MLPSVAIILAHAFILHMIRKTIRSSTSISDTTKEVLQAGVCAFELGCVCLEQGVLMERGGMGVWALSLFLVVVWQVVGWEGNSPSPIPHMLKGSGLGLFSTLLMLVCSLLSYRHMSNVWSYELISNHKDRAQAIASGVCSIPWQKTHLYQVVLAELVGTMVLCLLPPLILENKTLANNDSSRVIRGALVGCTVLGTVLAGMNTSGAMYNPSLASLLVGGCKGFTTAQHVGIYWVTPLVGASLGSFLHYRITRPSVTKAKKNK